MKTIGIVAEYDPFHAGHEFHLHQARSRTGADCIIIILGSEFLQRGRPSLFSKHLRARMAIDAGADLVIQMPYIYSCSSGPDYAAGAVDLLDGLKGVEGISFGCETANLKKIEQAASASADNPELSEELKKLLAQGRSFAEAYTGAVEHCCGEDIAGFLRAPNNLLAVEYVRRLRRIGSRLYPVPVQRLVPPDSHRSSREGMEPGRAATLYASASRVREFIDAGRWNEAAAMLPESTRFVIEQDAAFHELEHRRSRMEERFYELLRYRILTSSRESLAEYDSVDEGLESRILSAVSRANSLDEFCDHVKTKRYPLSRIRRMSVHLLMGLTRSEHDALRGVRYGRLLAFSETGRQFLKSNKKMTSMPVFGAFSGSQQYDESVRRSAALDLRAAGLYHMLEGGRDLTGGEIRAVPYQRRNASS